MSISEIQNPDWIAVPHTEPVAWSEAAKRELDAIFAKYPDKRSAMLPVLWLAVTEFGWISPQVEKLVSALMDQPHNEVHSVVTFYTMFPRKPLGRHQIQLCRNISCWLTGAVSLRDYLKEKLGVEVGETTADGKFTLVEVECLAACENAPAMRFDDRYEVSLTPEKLDEILTGAE